MEMMLLEIKKGQEALIASTTKKVAFCEEEICVQNILLAEGKEDEQKLIVDSGNPSTLGGRPEVEEYLKANDIKK